LTKATDENQILFNIEKTLEEFGLTDFELKIFSVFNGIFDENIYEMFKDRIGILKAVSIFINTFQFINKQSKRAEPEESMFFILVALSNMTMDRYSKNEILHGKIPSILYMLYLEQVFSEAFYIKYCVKRNVINYESKTYSREVEDKFLNQASEFSHWIVYNSK